jgi:hypothetical protein
MRTVLTGPGAGIKEVVTLTSDLSRKNLEKDFERMDTPQGTFYRMFPLLIPSSYLAGSRTVFMALDIYMENKLI